MNEKLQVILDKVMEINPLHGKKLRRNIKSQDATYFEHCGEFLDKYENYLTSINRTLDFGIESYCRMIDDFMYEQLRFQESGKYSNTSFDEVNQRVYNNPEVMEYFMNGLLLSQILWKHHYTMFSFFSERFHTYAHSAKSYLEVGGGHGLFISEAIRVLGTQSHFSLLDISPTSLEVSRHFVGDKSVTYILSDIFAFNSPEKYDFISMGEVLEHVENPVALLEKLKSLLQPNGVIFMTTPTNAPSIDHIYLFKNATDIREIISEAGLEVCEEIGIYAEDLPEEMAIELKITMMYGAFIKIKS